MAQDVEKSTYLADGTLFAEWLLDNNNIFDDLIAGGQKKKQILEIVSSTLKANPGLRAGFLKTLFINMAKEGDETNEESTKITNRRDAALEILADSDGQEIRLNKVMIPFVKAYRTGVFNAYLNAVSLQTIENNPLTGSMHTLLEAGKAIAKHLPPERQKQQQVISTWEALADQFPASDKKLHIYSEIEEIKKRMPPHPALTL